MRVVLLVGSLTLALIVGVLALQVPAPRGLETPAAEFSAARAMIDVRMMAQRPHPVGSPERERRAGVGGDAHPEHARWGSAPRRVRGRPALCGRSP